MWLRYARVPALLVTNPTNIRYLTGMSLSSGVVLLRRGAEGSALFVDDRYLERACAARCGITVRHVRELPDTLRCLRRCGFEAGHVTIAEHAAWKKRFSHTAFVPREGVLERLRRQKRPEELRALRRAERITEELLHRVAPSLRGGVTERELAWKLYVWAREGGADALAFDPIVAFGEHTSRPHHHPTSRCLRKGDLVQIDVGAKFQGYCADRSAVYFTGKPTDAQRKAYAALKETLLLTKKAVRSGVLNCSLDRPARSVLQKHGFTEEFCHALGHGVGLEIHEGVTLSGKAPRTRLLTGEVITLEPGLYFPGTFGMRLEEMVYVR